MGRGGITAGVRSLDIPGDGHDHGLLVLTHPLVELDAEAGPLLNDTYGNAMNQNGAFSGTALPINDGGDTALWTAQNVIGTKLTASSSDRSVTGNSIKIDNPSINDVWEIDKGSNQALTGYVALTMEVNIDKDWTSGDSVEVYGWDGSAEVGARVRLEDYMDETIFGVWHSVSIPLSDMGLTGETIQSIRMTQAGRTGKAARFYIDDMQLEETGEDILFKVSAPHRKTRLLVNSLLITIVDNSTTTVTDGTMPGLSYDKILGLSTLPVGFQIASVVGGEIVFQLTVHCLADLLGTGFEIKSGISDGVNTAIVLEQTFPVPLIISGPPELNFLGINIRDDMSGLIRFQALARAAIETPPADEI